MRVFTRYDLPDEKEDTRRARNERVGFDSPDLIIPEEGMYLWDWYTLLNKSVFRVQDGYYHPIAPTEFQAWSSLTGNLINPVEYEILQSMDYVFCEEMNNEIRSKNEREQQERSLRLKTKR